jgi:hypothetical protein
MQIPEERIHSAKERVEEAKSKTVEIQTMFRYTFVNIHFIIHYLNENINLNVLYRESEAQTDPFTPEYVIEKDNAPEVLTIAHLKYGRGLPASMAEMELIE